MPVISPESASARNKSCYTCVGGPSAEMGNFLRLMFTPAGQESYTVCVCVGQPYKIMYYDTCSQSYKTIIGTVSGISTEAIAVYTVSVVDKDGNVCLCSKKENLSGYIGTETYHIPINNIAQIQMYEETPTPVKPSERSETIVSVLGISSTVIHSVIVRLKIFDDKTYSTVTPVDMVVGRVYHVEWMKEKDHTMYEITGKLIKIEELPQFGNESPECGYVRPDYDLESVGTNGNIYNPAYFHSLPKYNPDGDRIRFVFDTSKNFNRLYDTVMLKEIRNVKDVTEPAPCPPPPPCYPPYPPMPYPPQPPCPPPPPCPPYQPGPGDWPPGWTPGGDSVDPGFENPMPPGWTPGADTVDPGFTNPMNPTYPNSNGRSAIPVWEPTQPISDGMENPNYWNEKVDPEFYK